MEREQRMIMLWQVAMQNSWNDFKITCCLEALKMQKNII